MSYKEAVDLLLKKISEIYVLQYKHFGCWLGKINIWIIAVFTKDRYCTFYYRQSTAASVQYVNILIDELYSITMH